MDLSLVFVLATVVYLLALRLIPTRKRALRFVCMSALFTVQTILIVALIGSPFSPAFKVKDLPREFLLQLLAWIMPFLKTPHGSRTFFATLATAMPQSFTRAVRG